MQRQMSPQEEEQQKKRDEEARLWNEMVADHYNKSKIGLAEWIRIDKRTPDDPGSTVLGLTGVMNNLERTMLGDGLYKREPAKVVSHWWRKDDEYEVQINVKNGQVWPTVFGRGFFDGAHLGAMNETNTTMLDFLRGEGASNIMLHMRPDNHGNPPEIHFLSDFKDKIKEIEHMLDQADVKDVALDFDQTMRKFLSHNNYRMKPGQEQWLYARRDQTQVNTEGDIRALDFNRTKEKSFSDLAEVQTRLRDMSAGSDNLKVYGYDALKGDSDKLVSKLADDLAKLDEKYKALVASEKKVDDSLKKFDVAMKTTHPQLIKFDSLLEKQAQSQQQRDALVEAMTLTRNDMEQQLSAMKAIQEKMTQEVNKEKEEIKALKEKFDKDKGQTLPPDPAAAQKIQAELQQRARDISERENKASQLEKKIPDKQKLDKMDSAVKELKVKIIETATNSTELGNDIAKNRDKYLANKADTTRPVRPT